MEEAVLIGQFETPRHRPHRRSLWCGVAASLLAHGLFVGAAIGFSSYIVVKIAAFGNVRPLSISAAFSEQAESSAEAGEQGVAVVVMPSETWQDARHFVAEPAATVSEHGTEAAESAPPVTTDATQPRPTEQHQPTTEADQPTQVARRRTVASVEPAIAPVNLPPANIRFVGRLNRYPEIARQLGWEGTVTLRIAIADDGTVLSVEVVKSSGHAVIDAEAVLTARGWRAVPEQPGGKVWASVFDKPVIFTLRGR